LLNFIKKTGAQRIGNYMGPLQQGQIYSGGKLRQYF
jgi:hypothetical protein